MHGAFAKIVRRSIRGSLGRFLAIIGIVALGCGFFAGLQMSGADMRVAADRYYDGTNLWDIRLISTLGFSDDDPHNVAAVRDYIERDLLRRFPAVKFCVYDTSDGAGAHKMMISGQLELPLE